MSDALYRALAQVTDRCNLTSGLAQLATLIGRLHPVQPKFYAGLGEGYLATGSSAKALASLEEAARRGPNSEIIQLELGNALMESKQWATAEAGIRAAVTLKPDDGTPWGFLGWVLGSRIKTEARLLPLTPA